MSHDTDKLIRQLSLVAFLMAERRPLTARDVKGNVEGYSEMSDEAFARRFYSDRAELTALGVPLNSQRDEFTGEELYTLRDLGDLLVDQRQPQTGDDARHVPDLFGVLARQLEGLHGQLADQAAHLGRALGDHGVQPRRALQPAAHATGRLHRAVHLHVGGMGERLLGQLVVARPGDRGHLQRRLEGLALTVQARIVAGRGRGGGAGRA